MTLMIHARRNCSLVCNNGVATNVKTEGSATEQNAVQDFKISEISGFLWDFNIFIGISRSHMDFKISMRFYRISLGFCRSPEF